MVGAYVRQIALVVAVLFACAPTPNSDDDNDAGKPVSCPASIVMDQYAFAVPNGGSVEFEMTAGIPLTVPLTIRNEGCQPLTLGAFELTPLHNQVQFTDHGWPMEPIEPGEEATFEIVGAGDIPTEFSLPLALASFETNDPEAPMFSFTLTGIVLPPCPPSVQFLVNGQNVGTHYDAGSHVVASEIIVPFTIANEGCQEMWDTSVNGSYGIEVLQPPNDTIEPGASSTFVLQLTSDDEGGYESDVMLMYYEQWGVPTGVILYVDWQVVPSIPGDLNGDGVVDVSDLLILLSAWGPCPDPSDCPADLNGDGAVDVSDLLILLSNWG